MLNWTLMAHSMNVSQVSPTLDKPSHICALAEMAESYIDSCMSEVRSFPELQNCGLAA